MINFALSVLASALTGIVLWAALPRGAVLTRTPADWKVWTIRNDSPVPIRITSVTWEGADTMEGGKPLRRELPADTYHDVPLRLVPDEDYTYYELTLTHGRWPGYVIQPGESMTAAVFANRSLYIKYRRAGWTGLLERRQISVHGGT